MAKRQLCAGRGFPVIGAAEGATSGTLLASSVNGPPNGASGFVNRHQEGAGMFKCGFHYVSRQVPARGYDA